MYISTTINSKGFLRKHQVSGVINIADLIIFLKGLYDSPDFDTNMDVVWDLREANFSLVSSSDVKAVKELVSKYWGVGGQSKAALIVSKDLDFGFTRMYEMLMSGVTNSKVMVFKNVREAHEWLGK